MKVLAAALIGCAVVGTLANAIGSKKKNKAVSSLKSFTQLPALSAEVEAAPSAMAVDVSAVRGSESLEMLVISTLDGYLHGVTADAAGRRNKKWSISSGGPMMTSMKRLDDATDYSVLPAVDGTLLVHHHDTNGLRKTSVTARMLAEKTPFINDDGLVFSGTKKSRLMGVDVSSGVLLHDSELDTDPDTENKLPHTGQAKRKQTDGELDPEDFSPPETHADVSPMLWLGRTDYTVRAFDSRTGREAFNLSYSEVRPIQRGAERRTSLVIGEAEGESMVISDLDGGVVVADRSGDEQVVLSELSLGSPAASAFSIDDNRSTGGELHFTARKVVHRSRPVATTLLESSALVANDIKALLLRSEAKLEPTEPQTQLALVEETRRSTGFREQLYRLTGAAPVLAAQSSHRPLSVEERPQLLLDYDASTGEAQYRLLPVVVRPSRWVGVSDPVLGTFDAADMGAGAGRNADSDVAPRSRPALTLLTVASEVVRALETLIVALALMVLVVYAAVAGGRRLGLRLPSRIETVVESASRGVLRTLGLDSKRLEGDGTVIETLSKAEMDPGDPNQVGSIVLSNDVLGYGSHGTVVYRGSLNGRPVAIKRMLAQFNKAASREVSLLIRSDGHANVVRYFLSEQKGEFIYLALQLCHMSLKDFVTRLQRSSLARPSLEERRLTQVPDEARAALQQIALGLNHLHSNRIVHRDIKPHNILLELRSPDSDPFHDGDSGGEGRGLQLRDLGQFTLKISDMGLSKQLDKDGSSFASMSMSMQTGQPSAALHSTSHVSHVANPVGTIGWQAPELMALRNSGGGMALVSEEESGDLHSLELDEDEESAAMPSLSLSLTSHRRTQRVDIFSLGCVFYCVLVPGEHPYGQWFEREANIMGGRLDLEQLSSVQEAVDLIGRMLDRRPEGRPSAKQLCRHPFFWASQRRLDFMVELSDLLEHEAADAPIVLAVETNAAAVVGRNWDRRLDAALLEDMGKYRKYDTSSVRDCLRVIRNKRNHFNELSASIREVLAPMPSGFVGYFEAKFPQLFMHCVRVACRFLAEDKKFKDYCGSIASLYQLQCRSKQSSEPAESRSVPKALNETLAVDPSADCSGTLVLPPGVLLSPTSWSVATSEEPGAPQLDGVVMWRGSALAEANRGWMRDDHWWVNGKTAARSKGRPAHLVRSSTDFRYRSRLCTHWELNKGTSCPMRKKGKCDFAHGPLELRVKDNRRERWGQGRGKDPHEGDELRTSGGEDVLGAARSIEKVRVKEGSVSDFERTAGTQRRAFSSESTSGQPSFY